MKSNRFFLILCVIAIAGCARTHMTKTGYLGDYSELKEDDKHKFMMI